MPILDYESCCTVVVLPSPDADPLYILLTTVAKKLHVLHTRMRKFFNSRNVEDDSEDDSTLTRVSRLGPSATRSLTCWAFCGTVLLGMQHLSVVELPVCKLQSSRSSILTVAYLLIDTGGGGK